jgi:hypothetical protein
MVGNNWICALSKRSRGEKRWSELKGNWESSLSEWKKRVGCVYDKLIESNVSID